MVEFPIIPVKVPLLYIINIKDIRFLAKRLIFVILEEKIGSPAAQSLSVGVGEWLRKTSPRRCYLSPKIKIYPQVPNQQ